MVAVVRQAAKLVKLKWHETNSLLLRRGPYVIAAGLDESIAGDPKLLTGRYINLFDPGLSVMESVRIAPGSRYFLRDLDPAPKQIPQLLASSCKALPLEHQSKSLSYLVEGISQTPAVVLLRPPHAPRSVTLDDQPLEHFNFSSTDGLLWIAFVNQARPRTLVVHF